MLSRTLEARRVSGGGQWQPARMGLHEHTHLSPAEHARRTKVRIAAARREETAVGRLSPRTRTRCPPARHRLSPPPAHHALPAPPRASPSPPAPLGPPPPPARRDGRRRAGQATRHCPPVSRARDPQGALAQKAAIESAQTAVAESAGQRRSLAVLVVNEPSSQVIMVNTRASVGSAVSRRTRPLQVPKPHGVPVRKRATPAQPTKRQPHPIPAPLKPRRLK